MPDRPYSPSRTYVVICKGLGDVRFAHRIQIPPNRTHYPNDTQGAYLYFIDLDKLHSVIKVVPNEKYEGTVDVDDLTPQKVPCSVCCKAILNRRPGYNFISGPAGSGYHEICAACGGKGEIG